MQVKPLRWLAVYAALILDADEPARFAIQNALRPYGFAFQTFSDPNEAVNRAALEPPQVFFLRVELPSMSGFSVFNKLKRADATKHIPIVLYASDVTEDVFERHRTLRSHAEAYLKLPVSDHELLHAVSTIVPLQASPVIGRETLEIELSDTEAASDDDGDDDVELVSDDELNEAGQDEDFDLTSMMDDELNRALGALTVDEVLAAPQPLAVKERSADHHAPREPTIELDEELLDDGAFANLHDDADVENLAQSSLAAATPATEPDRESGVLPLEDDEPTHARQKLNAFFRPSPLEEPEAEAIADAQPQADAEAPPTFAAPAPEPVDVLPSLALPLTSTLAPTPTPAPTPASHRSQPAEPAPTLAAETRSNANHDLDNDTLAQLAASVQRSDRQSSSDEPGHDSPSPGSLVQRRELLNIKAQLVKKDRELLSLRDEVESAQRSILDERRKTRELQAQIGEIEATRLGLEEQALTVQEQLDATLQDKATILRREDGLKQRLDAQQKRLRQVEQELEAALQSATETRRQQQAHITALEAQVATGRQREEVQDRELRSTGEALREQEQATKLALDRLSAAERVHAESREQWEVERQRLHAQFDEERERVRLQHSNELERQSRAWEQRLTAATTEFQLQLARKDEEQRAQLDHLTEQAADERAGFTRKIDALSAVIETRELELGRVKRDLEAAHVEHADMRRLSSEQAVQMQRERDNLANAQAEIGELKRELAQESSVLSAREEAIRRAQQALAIALKVLDQP